MTMDFGGGTTMVMFDGDGVFFVINRETSTSAAEKSRI